MSFPVQPTTFAISKDQFAILHFDFEIAVVMIAMAARAETEQVAGHSLPAVGVVVTWWMWNQARFWQPGVRQR